MIIEINERVFVDVTAIGKKNKTSSNLRDINLCFAVTECGIKETGPTYSTRIKVPVTNYEHGQIIGKGERIKVAQDNLQGCFERVKWCIKGLDGRKVRTSRELLEFIKSTVRQALTRITPLAQQEELKRIHQSQTYESIMYEFLNGTKNVCVERKGKYPLTGKMLNDFYDGNIPPIGDILKADMGKFKEWVKQKPLTHNTVNSYLSMVAKVFNYAVETDYILKAPLPKRFVEDFVRGKRDVLSNVEMRKWISLQDSVLTDTQKVAKYTGILLGYTGMGYGEAKTLKLEHKKYNENLDFHYIQKNRNKTGVEFIVEMDSLATDAWKMLQFLKKGTEYAFDLPSTEYMTRQFHTLASLAGINKNVTTYTFRHTYAVNWMDNRMGLEDLQKRLGHTDLKTTQIYAQISLERMACTARELKNKSNMHQIISEVQLRAV